MQLLAILVLCQATQPAPAIRAGAVNELQDGTYNAILFVPGNSGTIDQPTILKARNHWMAKVQPQEPYHCGVYAASDQVVHDIVIEGLVISGAIENGVSFRGAKRITIRDCRITQNLTQGIALYEQSDCLIERCEIDHNGQAKDAVHRHGVYWNGPRMVIRNCTVHDNSGYGLHGWEDAPSAWIYSNAIWNHPLGAGITVSHRIGAPPLDGALIEGNIIAACKIGLNLGYANQDRVVANSLSGCGVPGSLYPAARGPVWFDRNRIYGVFTDPAKMMVTTRPVN